MKLIPYQYMPDRVFNMKRRKEIIMAKGQLRGNKEAKKPKKSKDVVVPPKSVIPTKSSTPPKK